MRPITLKGMTWSHPRGYDPMVACSEDWLKQTGVRVEWDKRSLQDFESLPVEELARRRQELLQRPSTLLTGRLPERVTELTERLRARIGRR